MPDFTVNDRRSGSLPTRNPSTLAAANLRARGFHLPKSQIMAKQVTADVQASLDNRTLTSAMKRTGSTTRTSSNLQMALPKVREPMSSLKDKGIPFDTTKPKELKEIRKWARLFYSTHDLIPLLVDIYSKFPLVGLEFKSKDDQVSDFYESMFMDGLDYDTFLQDLGREFFISGEVNSFAHFDEALGIWSSEEILNPDSISVSKSMFQSGERVQLIVKDLVETLRDGQLNASDDEATRSEKLEKQWEYEQIQNNYPEIIDAAANDDGLDISDALISRMVNKVQPWDLRGTPHLLRSFRTLLMEESLNAAQDAVADRLYSPFILATLGIPNLGDGEPWIPDQADLDETRDTMQEAISADFRLMVHNFGLDIKSVFGRESVPRFDTDYARVDKKLMQAWGIGEALISGSSSSTYAGSALNREFVTQMMGSFQKGVKRHMRKRMEVIAEAQGHFDYEMKGGIRKPIFREIVETDPETGESYTRKVPKLLIPEVEFSTLNLRDEAQERQFLQQLRSNGVPISDKSLAVNIPIEFTEELEKASEEKVQKIIAEAQAMKEAIRRLEEQGLPITPELAKWIAATPQLQQEKANADAAIEEAQNPTPEPTPGFPGGAPGAPAPGLPGSVPGAPSVPKALPAGGTPPQTGSPEEAAAGGEDSGSGEGEGDNPFGVDLDNGIGEELDNSDAGATDPEVEPMNIPFLESPDNVIPFKAPAPKNRNRPEESDEMRKSMPRKSNKTWDGKDAPHPNKFAQNPSSLGAVRRMTSTRIDEALNRLASPSQSVHDLVDNDEFFESLNRQGYMSQVRNDIDEIITSIRIDMNGNPRLISSSVDATTGMPVDSPIRESFEILCEMVEQHEEVFGYRPEW